MGRKQMSFDISKTAELVDAVRTARPLVHCITNYVTVNDCANVLLAAGAAPVMADAIEEAADIASIANALVINIGTLNGRTVESMLAAGTKAKERGIPAILDPVGAGASEYRTATALKLVAAIPFAVIRGNLSEISTLEKGSGKTRGVDACAGDLGEMAVESAIAVSRTLARTTGAIVAITGAVDVISSGNETILVKNGHPMMASITGSGCMLTAIIGAYCGAVFDRTIGDRANGDRTIDGSEAYLSATVAAVTAIGLAGERAERIARGKNGGTATFRNALIDSLSRLDSHAIARGMKIESIG
jgi:hydroxyethylthiazole kinase